MRSSSNFIATLMIASLGSSAVAQGFLDKLEQQLDAAAEAEPADAEIPIPADAARPAPDEPAAKAPGYLGLIADEFLGTIRVELVRKGGPAEEAGILAGDVIRAINGRPVTTLDGLGDLLAPHAAGDRVAIYLRRGNAALLTNVVLSERPAAAAATPATSEPKVAAPASPPVDALDALERLDRLLEHAPAAPVAETSPPPADKPKVFPARIDELEGQLQAVRRRIAELEREIAELATED